MALSLSDWCDHNTSIGGLPTEMENNADVGICFLIEKTYVGGVTSAGSSSVYSLLPFLLSIPGDTQGEAGWRSEHLMEL